MKIVFFSSIVFLACLAFAGASAALASDLPTGGTSLLPPGDLQNLQISDPARVEHPDLKITGQPFQKAVEFTLTGPATNPWDVQTSCLIESTVKKGDVLHARIFARCAKSMTGSASVGIVYEMNKEPWEKSMEFQYSVGSDWTVIDVPFVAKRDFAPEASQFCVRLGYANQTIQIGGVELLNYGQGFDRSKLPLTRITYAGREADAPWRKAAAERIEKLRKADLTVTVKDPAGHGIPNAQVHVEMLRHEFAWGTAVAAGPMLGKNPDDQKYREILKKYFNQVTIENSLKWPTLERVGYKEADAMVPWLLENQFTIRGHNLIWPGKEVLPKKALALMDKPDELRRLCDKHITDTVRHYAGKLVDWDVINEPYTNHLIQDKLGDQEMAHWFKLAKAADPTSLMYLNDYEILASGNQLDSSHQNHYFNTIKSLLAQGAPVEGIGMQAHFSSNLTAPENLLKILDHFSQFKLPIKVTELDINLDDEQLRADYMRDLTTVVFSHPSVVGVIQWGFWEKAHWIPQSAIFDKSWNLRPHGQVWVDLVYKQWKTDVTQPTSAAGVLKLRAFKGDYEITVTTSDGKTIQQAARLTGTGSDVAITVK